MSHTPGPWQIIGEDDLPDHDDLMIVAFDVAAPEETPEISMFVCNIGSDGGRFGSFAPADAGERWPVSLANARLIAAAPEMLALLEQIIPAVQDALPYGPAVDLSYEAEALLERIKGSRQ